MQYLILILLFIIFTVCFIVQLIKNIVLKIHTKDIGKKNHIKVIIVVFLLMRLFYGVFGDSDNNTKWTRGVFFESHADEKTSDKMAKRLLKQISENPPVDYSYSVYKVFKGWTDFESEAYNNFAHKFYKETVCFGERGYDEEEKYPHIDKSYFYNEKENSLYEEWHIEDITKKAKKSKKELNFDDIIFKDEVKPSKKVNWEDLPCDKDEKFAKELLLFFSENYDKMQEEKLFDIGFKRIPMGNTYKVSINFDYKKHEYITEKYLKEKFGDVLLYSIEAFSEQTNSPYQTIKIDFHRNEKGYKFIWNSEYSVIDCERKILKWKIEKGYLPKDTQIPTDSEIKEKILNTYGKFPY